LAAHIAPSRLLVVRYHQNREPAITSSARETFMRLKTLRLLGLAVLEAPLRVAKSEAGYPQFLQLGT